ncbi:hypothetical protein LTR36_001563 [Oleoguttula mirabilis]|uniref:Uncharacterized protein n=1 Tax=Oleoguttula mirabilis TaxID=1507867 RepID=A0AAV9JPA3_9PEZI|nr:hypothetical protein LTR36_001563 [Oleoguttula mirabilis]
MAAQSPLLCLPGELRNAIYELVADSGDTLIFERDAMTSPPATLAAVNRQLQHEYLPILDLRARIKRTRKVQARIENFDFDALTRFLDSIRLISAGEGSGRELAITLVFTDAKCSSINTDSLQRWLRDCDLKHRLRGIASVTYVVADDRERCCSAEGLPGVEQALAHLSDDGWGSLDEAPIHIAVYTALSKRRREKSPRSKAVVWVAVGIMAAVGGAYLRWA